MKSILKKLFKGIIMLFKTTLIKNKFMDVSPVLAVIVMYVQALLISSGHEMIITDAISTPEQDRALNRDSTTHLEGRAVDIRTHGMTDDFKEEIKEQTEALFYEVGAVSKKTGKRNLIVIEEDHIHIQVRPDLHNLTQDILGIKDHLN